MKTALVTGSSRGIGRAVARELAHQGWAVGINYLHREDKAQELVEELTAAGCQGRRLSGGCCRRCRRGEHGQGTGGNVQSCGAGGEQRRRCPGQSLFQDISDEMWNRYLAVNLGGRPQHHQGGAAPHDLRKAGLHCQYLIHLGPAGRKLRGGLRLHQGGHHRSDPLSCHGAGSLRYPGELRGSRRHQHGHGAGFGAGNAGRAGKRNASRPLGDARRTSPTPFPFLPRSGRASSPGRSSLPMAALLYKPIMLPHFLNFPGTVR